MRLRAQPPAPDASRQLGFALLDLVRQPVGPLLADRFDRPRHVSSYAEYLAPFRSTSTQYRGALGEAIEGARTLDPAVGSLANRAHQAADGWVAFLTSASQDHRRQTAHQLGVRVVAAINREAAGLIDLASALAPPPATPASSNRHGPLS